MAMLSFMTLEPVAPATASFLRLAACTCRTYAVVSKRISNPPLKEAGACCTLVHVADSFDCLVVRCI